MLSGVIVMVCAEPGPAQKSRNEQHSNTTEKKKVSKDIVYNFGSYIAQLIVGSIDKKIDNMNDTQNRCCTIS